MYSDFSWGKCLTNVTFLLEHGDKFCCTLNKFLRQVLDLSPLWDHKTVKRSFYGIVINRTVIKTRHYALLFDFMSNLFQVCRYNPMQLWHCSQVMCIKQLLPSINNEYNNIISNLGDCLIFCSIKRNIKWKAVQDTVISLYIVNSVFKCMFFLRKIQKKSKKMQKKVVLLVFSNRYHFCKKSFKEYLWMMSVKQKTS